MSVHCCKLTLPRFCVALCQSKNIQECDLKIIHYDFAGDDEDEDDDGGIVHARYTPLYGTRAARTSAHALADNAAHCQAHAAPFARQRAHSHSGCHTRSQGRAAPRFTNRLAPSQAHALSGMPVPDAAVQAFGGRAASPIARLDLEDLARLQRTTFEPLPYFESMPSSMQPAPQVGRSRSVNEMQVHAAMSQCSALACGRQSAPQLFMPVPEDEVDESQAAQTVSNMSCGISGMLALQLSETKSYSKCSKAGSRALSSSPSVLPCEHQPLPQQQQLIAKQDISAQHAASTEQLGSDTSGPPLRHLRVRIVASTTPHARSPASSDSSVSSWPESTAAQSVPLLQGSVEQHGRSMLQRPNSRTSRCSPHSFSCLQMCRGARTSACHCTLKA